MPECSEKIRLSLIVGKARTRRTTSVGMKMEIKQVRGRMLRLFRDATAGRERGAPWLPPLHMKLVASTALGEIRRVSRGSRASYEGHRKGSWVDLALQRMPKLEISNLKSPRYVNENLEIMTRETKRAIHAR